jgi:hypothetical protein
MKAQEKTGFPPAKQAAIADKSSRPIKRRKVHVKEEPESKGDEGSDGEDDARELHPLLSHIGQEGQKA